nr:BspA family leucine-rich repeat surface protein [uncultured Allomuricauda sp.]
MTNKRYLWPWALVTAMLLLALSCGGNDDNDLPPTDDPGSNTAPVANDAIVSVDEDITDTETIIKVDAEDEDGDPLSYAIATNDLELFEVDANGAISLATGKTLDHGNKTQHQIKVTVSDGKEGSDIANITINVNAVQGGDLPNSAPELTNNEYDIPENVEAGITLVSLEAVDEDEGDTLTFSLTADESGLFALSESGELSLIAGGELDHETVDTYTVSLEIGDGTTTVEADIILNITDVNEEPIITTEVLVFNVSENASEDYIIASLTGNDPEGGELSFTLVENDNNLFEITPGGQLSLAEGQVLDFENDIEHILQVGLKDNEFLVQVEVTIKVFQSLAKDPTSFITTWTTEFDGQEVRIGTNDEFEYDYTIDWGDGAIEFITSGETPRHEYAVTGTYFVAIKGQFPALGMNFGGSIPLLQSVEQWGTIAWQTMNGMFIDCDNLMFNALDTPVLDEVTEMAGMFVFCDNFNEDLSAWDFSKVENMASMFNLAPKFNQSLANWNLASLTNAGSMLNNSGLSQENYEATLIGWAEADTTPDNVTLGAVGLTYCSDAAKAARNQVLIAQKGWTINGDTEDCN